jgi:integrase
MIDVARKSPTVRAVMNPKQVQTYVGHTDIRTTFNVYGHLLDGDVDNARAALDRLLSGEALPRDVSHGAP